MKVFLGLIVLWIASGYFFPQFWGIKFFLILIGILFSIMYFIKDLNIKDKKKSIKEKKKKTKRILTKPKQEVTKNTSSKILKILAYIGFLVAVLWTLFFILRLFNAFV